MKRIQVPAVMVTGLTTVAYPAGIILAIVFFGIFMYATKKQPKEAA